MQECERIYATGNIAMQGVEPDAATAWLKNRYREEMIEIHQHGEQEDEVSLYPTVFKEPFCHESREDQVQEIMSDKLEYLHHKILVRI
jgi:hypothetical protein